MTLEMSELPHFVFYVRMTIEEIPYVELTLVRLFAPSGLLWLGICMLRFDILEFRPPSDLKTYRYIRLRVVLRIISG
ncbi:hypothetical protein LEP1GSC005_2853 [Leptospira santarosai str. ST188]|nr:hypothetical protein LEP1GSC005_2853 [Leptospira santarosai str. ST188]EMO70489.1 hypothetical protein LEP1GSC130_3466 [Leptospira santarosai str. 200403458]EMO83895.1 hypothetical protein LEP1GSC070_0625 [Leptospira santarosai str. AIM]EMO96946.1 hypothetical protein LEP1GSC120_0123 [Leptospira santarosai str. 200702252]